MISFLISMCLLVVGYMVYGRIVERIFGPDNRLTPAVAKADGVDYVVLPSWKIFMIQFLNIAGTGPIFGAIMGAKFGPASYLWIVFGCIFAGAVHDYLSGMISMRHDGKGLPELVGGYMGKGFKRFVLMFSVFLLLMVGAVFVYSPAIILGNLTQSWMPTLQHAVMLWVVVVFIYYVIAAMLPIDKIIARIYPLFAFSLIFMALSLFVGLLIKWPSLPEVWHGLENPGLVDQPLFPCLFITIACGALSGFHATQSPLMARCIKSERMGRPVFYGAMITEGVVALIWATVSSYFFFDGGAQDVGSTPAASAPEVVMAVSKSWLGVFGGILAMLGVVAAPITSGDTALRSARLIIADALNFDQSSVSRRLMVSVPIFVVTLLLLWFNINAEDSFNVIWGYFGWANQTLAVFTLWTITVYLVQHRKPFLFVMIPALFMTMATTTFLFVSKNAFGLDLTLSCIIGGGVSLLALLWFLKWAKSERRRLRR